MDEKKYPEWLIKAGRTRTYPVCDLPEGWVKFVYLDGKTEWRPDPLPHDNGVFVEPVPPPVRDVYKFDHYPTFLITKRIWRRQWLIGKSMQFACECYSFPCDAPRFYAMQYRESEY